MANLFFVHTPFQLIVAQQIISQENLSNNILLYGYVGPNRHFLDIYNIVKKDSFWQASVEFHNMAGWASLDLHNPITSPLSIYKSYKHLNRIISSYKVDSIYLGDINNLTQKFTCVLYSRKNICVSFFEEGTSHYSYQTHNLSTLGKYSASVATFIYDFLFYIPFFGFPYARWRFKEDLPLKRLPLHTRFNMLSLHKEVYDKKLFYTDCCSNKAKEFIEKECSGLDINNSILFLDQPIYESVPGSLTLYIDTLKECVGKLHKNDNIIIKYHPRETKEVRNKIEGVFKDAGIDFKVISKDINLPVELYLQAVKFKEVISVYSSTAIYNGIMYPNVKFSFLLPLFEKKVSAAGLSDRLLLDNLMNQLDNILKIK